MATHIEVVENGEANNYTLVSITEGAGSNWLMTLQINGEYTVPQQRLMLEAMSRVLLELKE